MASLTKLVTHKIDRGVVTGAGAVDTGSVVIVIGAGVVVAGGVVVIIGAGAVVASDVVNVVVAFNCLCVAKVLKRLVPADVPRLVEGRGKFSDCIVSVHGWLRG